MEYESWVVKSNPDVGIVAYKDTYNILEEDVFFR